jgi:CRP-like cAMP-binding protein
MQFKGLVKFGLGAIFQDLDGCVHLVFLGAVDFFGQTSVLFASLHAFLLSATSAQATQLLRASALRLFRLAFASLLQNSPLEV